MWFDSELSIMHSIIHTFHGVWHSVVMVDTEGHTAMCKDVCNVTVREEQVEVGSNHAFMNI